MHPHDSCTGAELIIHLLEREGVELVAGMPGGALLPLYEALGRSKRIRHILARHEQAAGFIAQGLARATGRVGVCLATSGPGVTNVITALADAQLDSVPIVCIAGQVPTHLIGTAAFQEVPTIDMVRPITKASFFVRDAAELAQIVPRAFQLARSGRPGPVLIDAPKDVQLQRISWPTAAALERDVAYGAQAIHYDEAVKYINAAQRPILYAGGGVATARAHSLLREMAERNDIPVTMTLMGLGALPASHPLNLGMLGMHGARYTNRAVDECDLLIAIGARFDDRATGARERFAPGARIIHIDIDESGFGKVKTPTLAIHDDAGAALAKLIARLAPRRRPQWNGRIRFLRNAYPLRRPQEERVCSPYGLIDAVAAYAPRDAIVATDVGQHQMWVAQAYPVCAGRWLTSGGLGAMGFGLPAAIGAALAEPDATVICFTGDGSLLMNIQELATLAELDLNVKIIVMDNGALGLVRQQQELFYGRRFVASSFAQPSAFPGIARAFGVPAVDLEAHGSPHRALADALAEPGPMLIRAPIAAEHHVLPMVAPGAANVEAIA